VVMTLGADVAVGGRAGGEGGRGVGVDVARSMTMTRGVGVAVGAAGGRVLGVSSNWAKAGTESRLASMVKMRVATSAVMSARRGMPRRGGWGDLRLNACHCIVRSPTAR
jgi:hypothetical protein